MLQIDVSPLGIVAGAVVVTVLVTVVGTVPCHTGNAISAFSSFGPPSRLLKAPSSMVKRMSAVPFRSCTLGGLTF